VTEHTGNRIGRITVQGQITEYTVPTPNSIPMVVEPGPDGAMWFTEYKKGKISRISVPATRTLFQNRSAYTAVP
jgi:virginiamycin B lyase